MKLKVKILAVFLVTGLTVLAQSRTVTGEIPDSGKSLKTNSVEEVVKAMTLEEKVFMVIGNKNNYWSEHGFLGVGATYQCDRLGIPPAILDDGPAGLRIPFKRKGDERTYHCTAFPTATALAASWNPQLNEQVGATMGNEVLEYGSDVLLTPAINIQRDPLCGRNFEYYSEDPYLTGKMAVAMIRGVQSQGVGTSLKHFAVNNQETNRRLVNAVVSQRALREIYLRAFEIAVKEADPWSVMAAYNKVNGYYATQNKELLQTVLRDEWGYRGLVVSDWSNADDGVAQMRAGTDLIMPGFLIDYPMGPYFYDEILNGVKDHLLDEEVLDRNVARVLEFVKKTPRYKGYEFASEVDLKGHAELAKMAAEECMVLLKNEKKALPFSSRVKSVALFGKTFYDFIAGGRGSGEVNYFRSMSLKEGLQAMGYKLSAGLEDYYTRQIDSLYKSKEAETAEEDRKYIVASLPEQALPEELIRVQARMTDAAVITIGRVSGEGGDRKEEGYFTLTPEETDMIARVCDVYHTLNKKVVVVLNIGGVIETASWKDKPDAILLAFQAGQEGAGAVGRILKGKVNPSGKLPVSYPVKYSDTPAAPDFPGIPKDNPLNTYYNEGIYVGYRYYETMQVPVSYEFGYGLSYTQFEYSNLKISSGEFKDKLTVSVDVENIGKMAGKEIVQLYLSAPVCGMDKPAMELKGFAKTALLTPGQTETVRFEVDARALCSFDSGRSAWIADKGEYTVKIGSSSRDIRQTGTFTLTDERVVERVNDVLYPNGPVKDRYSRSGEILKGRSGFKKDPYYQGIRECLWRE